jgi:hypothetical protein
MPASSREIICCPAFIVPLEKTLHSRPGAPDKEAYRRDDAVEDEGSNDHALLDIAQLSSFSVRILLVFRNLYHLRLQLPAGFLRCADHDVW